MSSSIPSAVSALISIATAALPSEAMVWFGKALPAYTAPVTLQIVKVTGEQVVAEMGPSYRREETYAIHCQLSSWAGDNDHVSRLSEVFTNLAFVSVAVANNYTLNGAVRFAELKTFDYEPDADGAGKSLGRLDFVVECQARITSLT